jgi:CBS domain-containing protein/uncharacterized membrane protein YuzA (DUF378 family)
MLGNVDRAMKALLIVGGINWLSVAVGKFDLVAARRFGHTHLAARVIYGLIGGSALYALSRWIQEEAFTGHRPERAQQKQVREAMTPNPTSVQSSVTILEAAKLMKSEQVGSLPVLEGDRLLGIVTDRDIILRVVAEGSSPRSRTAGDIASRDPETTTPGQDLDEALRLMARRQIRRLPVVEGNRLVGMLAQADIAEEAPAHQAGEMIEKISR